MRKRENTKKNVRRKPKNIYNENNILGHLKNGQILVEEVQKYKD
jgi:hypothetical protein